MFGESAISVQQLWNKVFMENVHNQWFPRLCIHQNIPGICQSRHCKLRLFHLFVQLQLICVLLKQFSVHSMTQRVATATLVFSLGSIIGKLHFFAAWAVTHLIFDFMYDSAWLKPETELARGLWPERCDFSDQTSLKRCNWSLTFLTLRPWLQVTLHKTSSPRLGGCNAWYFHWGSNS